MPQYFKQHGERLAELGYRIVPLPPGSKGPNRKGWPKFELTAPTIRQWAANGSANDGIGVLAATTPAIDVDILDPEVAQQMSDAIDAIFPGQALMTRTGRAPKFLIPFRSDEPFRKISSAVYTDGQNEHKVEILGDGQQWVAYHTHPDTGLPYTWFNGIDADGIRTVERGELPILTRNDAQRVVDAFEVLAATKVVAGLWTRRVSAPERTSAEFPSGDPFAAHAAPVTDLTRAQIEALIHRCDSASYDRWISVGMMLHHQYAAGEEGFDIWDAWSANAHNYDETVMRTHWESFGNSSAAPQTLRALIKEFGQPPGKPEPTNADLAFRFHSGNDYARDFAGSPELIEDVLPAQGIGMLFGPSNDGKSTWALDLAFHVHNGVQWRDKDVVRGDVMYIAAEAGRSIKKRIQAVRALHPDWNAPFIADVAPNLSAEGSLQAVRDAAQAAGTPAFLIVDTMSASFEGDDSSQQDVAKMMRNLKILADDLQCLVMFVHHTTKEGSSYRGSGVLFADGDFVLELVTSGEGADTKRWIVQRKHRDGEAGKKYPFALAVSEPIGHKPNGKPITSVTIEQANFEPPVAQKKERKSTGGEFERSEKYGKARKYLSIIEDLVGLGGANVDETDVITAIQDDETVNPLKEPDNPRPDSIKRTLLRLGDLGKIHKEGRWIRLSH